MNCDRALEQLATGGPLGRWRAARHVAHCPDCSARAEALQGIIEALAEIPPLTEFDRRSWMNVAETKDHGWTPSHAHAPREHATRRAARRLAIAATILGLLPLGYWLATRPRTPPDVAAVVKQATLRDLDDLQADASTLSKELDDLLREVDLLDARRDVEALEVQLASLGGRRDP